MRPSMMSAETNLDAKIVQLSPPGAYTPDSSQLYNLFRLGKYRLIRVTVRIAGLCSGTSGQIHLSRIHDDDTPARSHRTNELDNRQDSVIIARRRAP